LTTANYYLIALIACLIALITSSVSRNLNVDVSSHTSKSASTRRRQYPHVDVDVST